MIPERRASVSSRTQPIYPPPLESSVPDSSFDPHPTKDPRMIVEMKSSCSFVLIETGYLATVYLSGLVRFNFMG